MNVKKIIYLAVSFQIISMFLLNFGFKNIGIATFTISSIIVLLFKRNIKITDYLFLSISSIIGFLLVLFDIIYGDLYISYLSISLIYVVSLFLVLLLRPKKKIKKIKQENKYLHIENSNSFHKPECITIMRSRKKNIETVNKSQAKNKNLKPCRMCKP